MTVKIFRVKDDTLLREFECDEYSWGDNAIVLKKENKNFRREVFAVFPLSKFYLLEKSAK